MFKKPPHQKALANIKSSERRKLLQTIAATYGVDLDQLSKEDQLRLVPNTVKQANFKTDAGSSGIIYFDENETPVWFKERDSKLYPLVYTCWQAGAFLPVIITHPHVIDVLAGGADLMLPGTIPPFDKRAVKGVIVGVSDSAHTLVIKAIGVTNLNMTQFDRVIGRTGVAVNVIHLVGDELYKLAKVDITVPEEVKSITELIPESAATDTVNSEDAVDGNTEIVLEGTRDVATGDDNAVNNVTDDVASLSVEDLDKFFIRLLFQTIKTSEIDLPIPASTFMSQYIYKNLPVIDSSYANVKKTSWKKTTKFLKAMAKEGYLSVKGKDDDLQIIKLMSTNSPQIQNFVTHKTIAKAQAAPTEPTALKNSSLLQIKSWYKPTGHYRFIFNDLDLNYQRLYAAGDVKKILDNYVKKHGQVDQKNPKNLILDENLKAATGLKEPSAPRDAVSKAFLKGFSPHCEVIKPGQERGEMYKGEPPKIQVITETKIGRKTITKVVDFERFYIKPVALSDELKVKCQGSATIHECVQNPKLMEVQVQGPHGPVIVDLLKNKWGVPASFIKFEDKLKKNRKR